MKSVVKLLVACVVLYVAYLIGEPYVSEWIGRAEPLAEVDREGEPARSERHVSDRPHRPDPETEVVREAEPPPRPRRKQITCPTCEGEGRLSYVDRRGNNQIYPCRRCNITGKNNITLHAGAHLCPDCKGMGRTEVRESRRDAQRGFIISATTCQRCNATGVILPHTRPGPSRPTPFR